MKAATGELNLTLITVIAIGAILGFFWLLWPSIKEQITSEWGNATDNQGAYVETVDVNLI